MQIIYNNEIANPTKYDGYYATKSGKIITVKVKGGQGQTDFNHPREHCYKVDKDGYLEVCFSMFINGVQKRIYRRAHRVIWEAFNGDIPDGLTIDHIDKCKTNNSLSNLRLLTREENASIAHKGIKSSKRFKYDLYKNNIYIGNFDRQELLDLIGITNRDFYIQSRRVLELQKKGYYWIKANVEDIERVS